LLPTKFFDVAFCKNLFTIGARDPNLSPERGFGVTTPKKKKTPRE